MQTMREAEQNIDRKKLEDLHYKYINMAMDAQKKEDLVLSESHYQRAEYYLRAMNESSDFDPIARPSVRKSHSVKKVIKDFSLKRTSSKKTSSKHMDTPTEKSSSSEELAISPFRGSFLRRSRRGVQYI